MAFECSFHNFFIDFWDLNLLFFSILAPKNGNGAPNLHMWEDKTLRRVLYDHLRLNKISAVAFLIQTPRVKPGACHLKSPSRYQEQVSFLSHELRLILIDVTLNYLDTPRLKWYISKHKILENVRIPEVSRVWLMIHLRLQLETRAQIELLWEIEALGK
jgi:hypothetical protein